MSWPLLIAIGFAGGFAVSWLIKKGGSLTVAAKPVSKVEQVKSLLEQIKAERDAAKLLADDLDIALKGVHQ